MFKPPSHPVETYSQQSSRAVIPLESADQQDAITSAELVTEPASIGKVISIGLPKRNGRWGAWKEQQRKGCLNRDSCWQEAELKGYDGVFPEKKTRVHARTTRKEFNSTSIRTWGDGRNVQGGGENWKNKTRIF